MIPTVYIIAGPTAVGKTGIAIDIAQRLQTAIVSADSRQCYREMNIGTAKPSPEQLQAVKHYFVGEFPIAQLLSAADFELRALGYLNDVFKSHTTAVVCGGTGLYIKALCEGLDEMPEPDAAIVAATGAAYKESGLEWLQEAVEQEDPEFYRQGEIQNPARMLRALCFMRSTGRSIIHFRTKRRKERPFRVVKAGLDLPREVLYDRINRRVETMMEQGLLKEVEMLFPLRTLRNLQTVGYSELFEYLEGKTTLAAAVDKIKQHTRNYAKRQLTWFRKDEEITWFRADDPDVAEKIIGLS